MNCRICDNSLHNEIYTVREMMFGFRDKFEYFKCNFCGCLQIVQVPDNISKYYPAEYYSFISEPLNYKVNFLAKLIKKTRDNYAIFQKGIIGRFLFSIIPNYTLACLSHIPISKKSRILDVGCGSGGFLHTLKEIGFSNLLGLDPFLNSDILYENGLKIEKKSILDMDESTKWDLIMLHHSLEHIEEQRETLKMISGLLSDKGVCLIRVPIVSSYAWEKYKENWVQLDAPRHFVLHSIASMKLLADKTGMFVNEIIFDSNDLQFWGSEQNAKDIPLRSAGNLHAVPSRTLFSSCELKAFSKAAKKLNIEERGDQAAFYLHKK